MNYIKSTFNISLDVDAVQFSKNASLKLYDKPHCNIYITPVSYTAQKQYEDIYYSLVQRAADALNNLMQGKINFEIIDTPYKADVKVYWRKETATYAVGMQYKDNPTIKGVSVAVFDNNGIMYDFEDVYSVILHEFGHVLTLGHSNNKKDLMYWGWNPEVKDFSENDKFVLNLIYELGSGKSFFEFERYINEKVLKYKSLKREIRQDVNLYDELSIIANFNKWNVACQNIGFSLS